jgi:hypothetical protein
VDNNAFQGYWRVFGGVTSLFGSPYLLLAVILVTLTEPIWSVRHGLVWIEIATAIVPNLLGFALGGMAIMLSFSSGRFLEAIRQNGRSDSYFMKVIASFFHLSLVLSFCLIVSILSRIYPSNLMSAFGICALFYGVLLIPATAASIWHTARIFNAAIEN